MPLDLPEPQRDVEALNLRDLDLPAEAQIVPVILNPLPEEAEYFFLREALDEEDVFSVKILS